MQHVVFLIVCSISSIILYLNKGQASPGSKLRAVPQVKSPAAKNPRPSFLWACTVFLSASAQSTHKTKSQLFSLSGNLRNNAPKTTYDFYACLLW
jgi:hypothetical protein